MNRVLLLATVILFALSGTSVNAKVRTSSEAQAIARQHFATPQATSRAASPGIVRTISASEIFLQAKTRSGISGEPFYVLVASNGSHVIVSGDDRMTPVLGYSDKGFDKDNINVALKDLLSIYCTIYDNIQLKGGSMAQAPQSYSTRGFPASVSSLLAGTEWNQLEPYNNMCPILDNGKRAYTGCVATATAMVMHYHKYPQRGTGKGIGKYNEISLDSLPFTWDKMQKKYKGTTDPPENQAAVAWLMRAVSASIATQYDYTGAGSSDRLAAWALSENFGYDKGLVSIRRPEKTLAQWTEIIKAELAASRPVIYSGIKSGFADGHCFVLDGYDSNGLFSVNWGWGGVGNGFYAITALDGYVTGESAIIGIQSPANLPYVSKFKRTSSGLNITPTTLDRDGVFSLPSGWGYNNRGDTFSGEIALVLFKDGKSVATVGTSMKFSMIKRNDAVTVEFKNMTIPPGVAAGRYQMYVATKAYSETEWQPVAMDLEYLPYYNVEINASQVLFTSPVVEAKAKVLSITPDSEKIYFKERMGFTVEMQHDGTEVIKYFDIRITSLATGWSEIFKEEQRCVLLPGVNKFYFLKAIFFDPGEYKIELLESIGVISTAYEVVSGSEKLGNIKILAENFEKYEYCVVISSSVTELNVVTNKKTPSQLVLELTNVGAKDIEDAYFLLMTQGSTTMHSQLYLSIKKGETKKVALEPPQNLPDGDYTFSFVLNYPKIQSPSPITLRGEYKFGVRTLRNE